MRAVLDTSVLIGENAPAEGSDQCVSLLVATDGDERARRIDRLFAVEATFEPLPLTAEVARAWGRLAAAVTQRGGNPRCRRIGLAIAATASVEQVPLLAHNVADFQIVHDLVDARPPSAPSED